MDKFNQLIADNANIQSIENYLSSTEEQPDSWSFIIAGARMKTPEVKEFLIKQAKADKTAYKSIKLNKLHLAAILGTVDVLENASEEELTAKTKNYYAWRPLHFATVSNNFDVVKLIAKKVNVDLTTNHGITPLCLAIEYNLEEMVSLLISLGAKVDQQYVIRTMNPKTSNSIITQLTENGLDLKIERNAYSIQVDYNFSLESNLKFIDQLFDLGMVLPVKKISALIRPVNEQDGAWSLPLLKAILNRSDIDINEKLPVGISLFEFAMKELPLEVAEYLHSIGATCKKIKVRRDWRFDKKAKGEWLENTFDKIAKPSFREFMETGNDLLTPKSVLQQLSFKDGKFAGMDFPLTNEILVANGFDHDDELGEFLWEVESIESGYEAEHRLTIDDEKMVYDLYFNDEKAINKIYKELRKQFSADAGEPKGNKTLCWADSRRKLILSLTPLQSDFNWLLKIEVTPVENQPPVSSKIIDTSKLSKNIENELEDLLVDVFNEGETMITKFKVHANQPNATSPINIVVEFTGKDDQNIKQSDSTTIELEERLESAEPTNQLIMKIIEKVSDIQRSWETNNL